MSKEGLNELKEYGRIEKKKKNTIIPEISSHFQTGNMEHVTSPDRLPCQRVGKIHWVYLAWMK